LINYCTFSDLTEFTHIWSHFTHIWSLSPDQAVGKPRHKLLSNDLRIFGHKLRIFGHFFLAQRSENPVTSYFPTVYAYLVTFTHIWSQSYAYLVTSLRIFGHKFTHIWSLLRIFGHKQKINRLAVSLAQ